MLVLVTAIWGLSTLSLGGWQGQCAPFPIAECENVRQIAWCESRWDPLEISTTNDWGLMAINRIHEGRVRGLGYRLSDLLEWRVNLIVAHDIWLEQGWNPWRCNGRLRV